MSGFFGMAEFLEAHDDTLQANFGEATALEAEANTDEGKTLEAEQQTKDVKYICLSVPSAGILTLAGPGDTDTPRGLPRSWRG